MASHTWVDPCYCSSCCSAVPFNFKIDKNAQGLVKGSFWGSLVICLNFILSTFSLLDGPHRILKGHQNPNYCSSCCSAVLFNFK